MERILLDPLVSQAAHGIPAQQAVEMLAPLLGMEPASPAAAQLGQHLVDHGLPSVTRAIGFGVHESPVLATMIGDPRAGQRTLLAARRRHGALPSDAVRDDWLQLARSDELRPETGERGADA